MFEDLISEEDMAKGYRRNICGLCVSYYDKWRATNMPDHAAWCKQMNYMVYFEDKLCQYGKVIDV